MLIKIKKLICQYLLLASSDQKALPSCGLPKPFTFVLDSVGLGGFVFRPIYMPKAIVQKRAMAFIMLISFIF